MPLDHHPRDDLAASVPGPQKSEPIVGISKQLIAIHEAERTGDRQGRDRAIRDLLQLITDPRGSV